MFDAHFKYDLNAEKLCSTHFFICLCFQIYDKVVIVLVFIVLQTSDNGLKPLNHISFS